MHFITSLSNPPPPPPKATAVYAHHMIINMEHSCLCDVIVTLDMPIS